MPPSSFSAPLLLTIIAESLGIENLQKKIGLKFIEEA